MNIIRIDDMTIAKIRLGDVRHNPFRRFDEFPLIEKKVLALQNSIQETGFWDNVLGRVVEGGVEIAYGHHRIEAAKRVYGDDHEIGITIRELSDVDMLRVMGLENSEDWMNPVQHAHLIVKQARSFFDSWFDRFPTWDDFRHALENKSIPEFGSSWDTNQVARWLGGGDSPATYANLVKYGVGAPTISRFTNLTEDTSAKVLSANGPSEREKRMLSVIEEERRKANELIAQQREAEEQARREIDDANRKAKEAEDERRKQAAIARNVVDEPKKVVAQEKADKQAKIRDDAKIERDAAAKRAKDAENAQRAAEKKAKEANDAEKQKRKAAEEQELYDQAATQVWYNHSHVAEFRRLCLLPGNRDILPKARQAEFATYIRDLITKNNQERYHEVTSDKIRQYFDAEVRNFIAGVRKQNEEENPILKLQRKLESLHDKSVSVSKACHDVINESKRLNVVGINGIGAYDLKESLEAMLQTLSGFYAVFHLQSDYLAQKRSDSKSIAVLE